MCQNIGFEVDIFGSNVKIGQYFGYWSNFLLFKLKIDEKLRILGKNRPQIYVVKVKAIAWLLLFVFIAI